ncbi:MAG: hypothetical protein DRQ46_00325 [Gammaproteobacteria bacterium]|nr:MAG: hypothetical protein DRQ46_00325 [Gammaproteobacteria bacterium]
MPPKAEDKIPNLNVKEIVKGEKMLHVVNYDIISINEKDRTMKIIATTSSKDRDGDNVRSDGLIWDAFLKNPVMLWAHDHSIPPIARALNVRVFKNKTELTVQFHEETELAREVWELYKKKYMRAWSIGFIPLEWEEIRAEKENEYGYKEILGYDITKAEIVEVSAVPVPANAEALSKSVQSKILMKDVMAALFSDKVEKTEEKEEPLFKLKINDDGVGVYYENVFVETFKVADSAFTKSIKERGASGKIPVDIEVTDDIEKCCTNILFDVIKTNDEYEITEAKIISVEIKVLSSDVTLSGNSRDDADDEDDTIEDPNIEPDKTVATVDVHSMDEDIVKYQALSAELASKIVNL